MIIKIVITVVTISSFICCSKPVFTNDFFNEERDFFVSKQKLDYNIDILDGVVNNSYEKPLYAKVPTDIYILDSGCIPLAKSFVNDSIGYHGMAVALTLNITLPVYNTTVKCIKTLPAGGSGQIGKYMKALQYILALGKPKRTIINISASVPNAEYLKINKIVKQMARKGFEFVFAAGNLGTASPLGANACLYSLTNLARHKNIYVVGTSDWYSRNGRCVEKFYPGSYKSVHPLSGTSFAAPIFTGILASL